jgi:rRNA maturation endonuclease Nob1
MSRPLGFESGTNAASRTLHETKDILMKTIAAAVLLIATATVGTITVTIPARAAVPCEEALKDMRAAKAIAKLSDADMKKVDALEAKAVERCNADDDARSDTFSTEAMKIMGK